MNVGRVVDGDEKGKSWASQGLSETPEKKALGTFYSLHEEYQAGLHVNI